MVSVGEDQSQEPVVFYDAGDHYTETLRRDTIRPQAARAAMRHFVATGELSPDVSWEEV
jgi:Immunity protein Imm1